MVLCVISAWREPAAHCVLSKNMSQSAHYNETILELQQIPVQRENATVVPAQISKNYILISTFNQI